MIIQIQKNLKLQRNQKSENNSNILIGSAIYKFDDTFMTGVRTAMEKQSDAEGVKIELVDSQNKQPTQNEQVDTFITKGVNALAINAVDRTAAGPIIEKAKAKDLPIVFFKIVNLKNLICKVMIKFGMLEQKQNNQELNQEKLL